MQGKEQLRSQIIQYFRSVGSGENILQCIKQALFLHESFNPVVLYETISKGKQKATSNDLRNYLLQRKIIFKEEQFKYYLKQNGFKHQFNLNQFLEALIPYNADVVRQFKLRYTDALEIRQLDAEVEFIFCQLLENEIKFFRNMISIRNGLTRITNRRQIQNLVKEDLVLQSKPREARKFHEAFQASNFQLGFHELRRFLELWVPAKEIIHQFYLLNVMRHLKTEHPFKNIILKQRSSSANPNLERSFSSKAKKAKDKSHDAAHQFQDYSRGNSGDHNAIRNGRKYGTHTDKYSAYKNELEEEFQNMRNFQASCPNSYNARSESCPKKTREEVWRPQNQRENRGIDGTYLIDILTQMAHKEEQLEKLRKLLAKANDFNLINLFKLIDTQKKGYISAADISEFTQVGKVQFNYMVDFYARELDRLRFYQFCLIFRPLSRQLNEQIDSRPENKVPNPFRKDTTKLILEIFTLTAQMHTKITQIKRKIMSSGGGVGLFSYLDLEGKGYISASCIQKALNENNIHCDDKILKCIMKLFRKKLDERISATEFTNFIGF